MKIFKNIIIIVVSLLIGFTIIYCFFIGKYQKSYWNTYFKTKSMKIELARPEQVDSLINEINIRDSIISCQKNQLEKNDSIIISPYKHENIKLKKDMEILKKVISSQYTTIKC